MLNRLSKQSKDAELLDLSLRLQDACELTEGLRKELKTSQADKEAQVSYLN
jgi:hypothetical protein